MLVAMVALVAVALVALLSNDNLDDTIAAGEMDIPGSMAPSTADAVVHQPVPWVAFGELPGDWRYEEFFTYVVATDRSFTGQNDEGHIQFDAVTLDEVLDEVPGGTDFEHWVEWLNEVGPRELRVFDASQPFALRGGLEGVQFWVQEREESGGAHASYLIVNLGDQLVIVALTYREGHPGSPGAPTRGEVDAWLRTIVIDPAEVRFLLEER